METSNFFSDNDFDAPATQGNPAPRLRAGDGLEREIILSGYDREETREFEENLGVETMVNRASISPFAPIKKVPSHTDNGNLTGYGIEIADPEADTGWDLISTVSPSYLLVPNRDVIQVAREVVGRSPFKFEARRVFFDGRRFRYEARSDDFELRTEVQPGDDIAMGILFENSYDQSRSFRAMLYAERLICSNGMTSKQAFATHTFKHTLGESGWQDDVRKALGVLEEAPAQLREFTGAMRTLARAPVDLTADLNEMRRVVDHLPVSRWGEIAARFLQHEDQTAWGFMNACTQVLWHRNKSVADITHSTKCVEGLLEYAEEHQN